MNLTEADLAASAVTRNAMILHAASEVEALRITAAGNLARTVVSEMMDRFEWPGFVKADTLPPAAQHTPSLLPRQNCPMLTGGPMRDPKRWTTP